MNRVFVCGDTHGHHDIKKLTSKNFPEGNELTKNDYLIQLGDFGLVFHNNQTAQEKYWLDWLNDKPWTTLFIDGNHDNHPKLDEYEQVNMFGNRVGVIKDNIFHLKRGKIYNIAGKTFFTLGGAFSIDKAYRTEGIDWWATEEPNYSESKIAYANLDKVGWKVDYILTHDAPSWIKDVLHSHHIETSYTVRLLDDIFGKQKFDFKHHYFGHHHMDKTVMEKHTCCYHKIHELD